MIEVDYQKQARCPVSKLTIQRIINQAARIEKKITGIVSVIIVDESVMRKLNHRYRGKDKPTDVLSFAWQEDKRTPSGVLAEIYLCYSYIAAQAKTFEVSAKEEFARMLIHGLLHSVGYDHVKKNEATKMFALQEKIVKHV